MNLLLDKIHHHLKYHPFEKKATAQQRNFPEKRIFFAKKSVSEEADAGNALVETFLTAEDVDLDTQIIQRHVAAVESGDAHGIFFGGDDHIGAGGFGLIYEVDDLLLGIAVVVGEVIGQDEFCAELFQKAFKTVRSGDRT